MYGFHLDIDFWGILFYESYLSLVAKKHTGQPLTEKKHKAYSALYIEVMDLAAGSLGKLPVTGQGYTARKIFRVFLDI